MGLREQKKIQTRKAISDMATKLFIEKGYANVTVAEIAEKALVSVPTLFNYFPNKESFVFDEDKEREERILEAVVSRKKGTSILDALYEFALQSPAFSPKFRKDAVVFRNLVKSAPELFSYERQINLRYEKSLAKVIKKESNKKLDEVEAQAIAHFVLDAFYRASEAAQPQKTLHSLFEMIKNGVRV